MIEQCVKTVTADAATKGMIIPERSVGEGFWARCKELERSCYVGDDGTLFVEPGTLRLDPNWIGDIVWYVFTKGYSFPEENAVVFPSGSGFTGTPLPDPSRPGCWSTAATNNDFTTSPQSFSYSLTVLKADGTSISGDPVIENEPVP